MYVLTYCRQDGKTPVRQEFPASQRDLALGMFREARDSGMLNIYLNFVQDGITRPVMIHPGVKEAL